MALVARHLRGQGRAICRFQGTILRDVRSSTRVGQSGFLTSSRRSQGSINPPPQTRHYQSLALKTAFSYNSRLISVGKWCHPDGLLFADGTRAPSLVGELGTRTLASKAEDSRDVRYVEPLPSPLLDLHLFMLCNVSRLLSKGCCSLDLLLSQPLSHAPFRAGTDNSISAPALRQVHQLFHLHHLLHLPTQLPSFHQRQARQCHRPSYRAPRVTKTSTRSPISLPSPVCCPRH